jgi:hypothetical protein
MSVAGRDLSRLAGIIKNHPQVTRRIVSLPDRKPKGSEIITAAHLRKVNGLMSDSSGFDRERKLSRAQLPPDMMDFLRLSAFSNCSLCGSRFFSRPVHSQADVQYFVFYVC